MTQHPYRPVDAATGWTYSLTDPLLPLHRRAVFEDAMATVCGTHPRWAVVYLAGSVTCIAATLPPTDPWRHLRATVAGLTVGDPITGLAPGQDAVVGPDGRPFGTWRDAVDLLVPWFDEPESDPQLAPLADGLPAAAGAVLAAAGRGDWRATARVLTAAVDAVLARAPGVPALSQTWSADAMSTVDGYVLRDVGRAALVWAIHRRRAYVGWDDPTVLEVLLSWAARAGRVVDTEPADPATWTTADTDQAAQFDQTVADAITRERIQITG